MRELTIKDSHRSTFEQHPVLVPVTRDDGLDRLPLVVGETLVGRDCVLFSHSIGPATRELQALADLHTILLFDGVRCEVVDRGSANGTLLNNRLLTPNEIVGLNDGDELVFGHPRFHYRLSFLAAPPADPVAPVEPNAVEQPRESVSNKVTSAGGTTGRSDALAAGSWHYFPLSGKGLLPDAESTAARSELSPDRAVTVSPDTDASEGSQDPAPPAKTSSERSVNENRVKSISIDNTQLDEMQDAHGQNTNTNSTVSSRISTGDEVPAAAEADFGRHADSVPVAADHAIDNVSSAAVEEGPDGGRSVDESRLFSSSIDALGRVLDANSAPVQMYGDPLLDAATLVGSVDGIKMVRPGASEKSQLVSDPIESIARASHIRFRNVILADDWWNSDCGAMLGYLEDGHQPVALIPTSSGSYDYINPAGGDRTAVSAETAAMLELKAVRFYRRLPDQVTSVWQLPRWALRGRLSDLIAVAALSLVITLLGMLVPQATALVVDNAIPDANQRLVAEIGLAMVLAAFGMALFSFAQGVISVRLGIISDSTSQSAVWDRLLSLKLGLFRQFSNGDLLDRAMGVSAVNRELNGQTMRSLLTSLSALLNLALLYWYSSKLATMVLGIGVVVLLFTVIAGMTVRKYYRTLMDLQGKFFGFVVELVGATGKIRVAGAQRRAFTQWSNRYGEQLGLSLKAQQVEDYIIVFNNLVPLISAIFLYWMAAGLLAAGSADALSVGTFLAFNTAMGTFLSGVTFLSNTALEFMDTLAKANRTKPLLAAETEVGASKVDPGILRGRLALSDVHFRYSSDGLPILKGLSLQIEPEEFVAFVGSSGSGKSTIFRLLLGFEEPSDGRVLFDDQDLSMLDVTAVRRQLGVVLQNARINSASILENIGAGAPISMEQAWAAAEDAGFAADIHSMPMGMQTVISEGGGNLSGGQRQRLMIARALVRDPKILLFDEATSALDNKTQAIVSSSLNRRKVTRVVIAHRLSTIREASNIFVLDDGRIVESGTFSELSENGGLFESMMRRQRAEL